MLQDGSQDGSEGDWPRRKKGGFGKDRRRTDVPGMALWRRETRNVWDKKEKGNFKSDGHDWAGGSDGQESKGWGKRGWSEKPVEGGWRARRQHRVHESSWRKGQTYDRDWDGEADGKWTPRQHQKKWQQRGRGKDKGTWGFSELGDRQTGSQDDDSFQAGQSEAKKDDEEWEDDGWKKTPPGLPRTWFGSEDHLRAEAERAKSNATEPSTSTAIGSWDGQAQAIKKKKRVQKKEARSQPLQSLER